MSALRRYEWPGNIRQLENYLRRIFVLSENEVIDKDELPPRNFRYVAADNRC